MALPELTVMQQSFELLYQLDPQARRRVLKWVKAALDEADSAPVSAATSHLDAEVPQTTDPDDTSVVDEPAAADIAGEPASAVESGSPADDRDGATTPAASSPAPAADPPGRRAAKPVRGRAKSKTATPPVEASPVVGADRRGRPPADEIMRVYKQVDGKLTELAKHYGKPYGTIQGWASTLREQGYPIGRSRKS
ncbi:hypothetical protein DMB66_55015 [Actinoplanes sp. ATCC 53533]|uniref:hypothetical protein n=1 Tax=Actinoplanes sp. ATCC 53533 TaxID=1288362 RepID=UPI000F7AB2EC|nr:hypothetical protein [Actinoplanes sp. ATCC 53533]RSM42178.1 hypothetical protein DMB66_55015 [Actinoplanes sp. ATCC 53533]